MSLEAETSRVDPSIFGEASLFNLKGLQLDAFNP